MPRARHGCRILQDACSPHEVNAAFATARNRGTAAAGHRAPPGRFTKVRRLRLLYGTTAGGEFQNPVKIFQLDKSRSAPFHAQLAGVKIQLAHRQSERHSAIRRMQSARRRGLRALYYRSEHPGEHGHRTRLRTATRSSKGPHPEKNVRSVSTLMHAAPFSAYGRDDGPLGSKSGRISPTRGGFRDFGNHVAFLSRGLRQQSRGTGSGASARQATHGRVAAGRFDLGVLLSDNIFEAVGGVAGPTG